MILRSNLRKVHNFEYNVDIVIDSKLIIEIIIMVIKILIMVNVFLINNNDLNEWKSKKLDLVIMIYKQLYVNINHF